VLSGVFAWIATQGSDKGEITHSGQTINRDKQPLLFWFTVAVYWVIALMCLGFGAMRLVQILWPRLV
jgi:hypothetical protein